MNTDGSNLKEIAAICAVLTAYIPNILVTLGKGGVLYCGKNSQTDLTLTNGSFGTDLIWVGMMHVLPTGSISLPIYLWHLSIYDCL